MECEHCNCREAEYYCSSWCGCQDGGGHLCFDEDDKYLGCWSHAETVRELFWMARQVANSMPEGSQVRADCDDRERPAGWPLALPFDRVSGSGAVVWFLDEDGTLNFRWAEGTVPSIRETRLRWQVLEEESELPAARNGEALTPKMISRALVGLLR